MPCTWIVTVRQQACFKTPKAGGEWPRSGFHQLMSINLQLSGFLLQFCCSCAELQGWFFLYCHSSSLAFDLILSDPSAYFQNYARVPVECHVQARQIHFSFNSIMHNCRYDKSLYYHCILMSLLLSHYNPLNFFLQGPPAGSTRDCITWSMGKK